MIEVVCEDIDGLPKVIGSDPVIFLALKTKARRLHSTLSEHQIKNGAIIIVTRIIIGTANQTMRRNPSS